MTPSGSNKKIANSLVAVSCAAVLAVYTAGYARTKSAASQFEVQAAERRTAAPDQQRPASPSPEFRPPATYVAPAAPRPTRAAATNPEPTTAAEVQGIATVSAPVETAAPSSPVATVVPPPPLPAAVPVAPPAPAPPPAAAPAPAPKWKDGTFTGWGTSRHGNIQAEVVIEDGRILSATIISCQTRYSCSVIDMLPPQVTQRQSPDVDVVSRATQSADAFYYAVVEALGKAK